MHNILSLFRILLKNAEMPMPQKGTKGRIYLSMGITALCCIMIPCCLIVGFVSYVMTLALDGVGTAISGLLAELHIMSAFSVVFGMLVIFNILFFSSDREHLVTLPFQSHEILAAKFFYAYFAESIMEFLVLLSMFTGYFLAVRTLSPIALLSALISVILVPILPMVYCGIISLLLMFFLKKVKNARIFHSISTIFLLLFVCLFLLSFQGMNGITVENYVNSIAGSQNLFIQVLNPIFYTVPILCEAIQTGHLLSLVLYLLGNLFAVGIMLLLGRFLYQSGLHTAAALGSGKKTLRTGIVATKSNSPLFSCLKKEWRVLIRTKAYSANCVYINLLWPVGLLLFLHFNHSKGGMGTFLSLYKQGNPKSALILLMGILIVAFLASALNSLSSTAFTREGAHLSLIKYIPVPYRTQMTAKALICFLLTYPILLICIGILQYYFGFSIWHSLYYAALVLCCHVISNIIGLALDSTQPYTTWDDEYSALRGNLNSFFNMAVIMILAVFLSALCFLSYELFGMTLSLIQLVCLVILGIAAIIVLIIGTKRIVLNMAELS